MLKLDVSRVYNAGRTNGNDSIGFAPRGTAGSGNSGLSSGAVAGISIGATLGFVALLAILFFWWRHKRAVRINNGEPIKEKKGQHKIDPFTPTSSSTPMFNVSTANGGQGRPYIIEQGPIGGEVGTGTGLLSSMSPESSPQTTTMSSTHRRKAEEAGLLAAGAGAAAAGGGVMQVTNHRRPPSSQTNTTSTDFVQHLPPQPPTPATPATPEALSQNVSPSPGAQAAQFPPEGLVRHISSGTGFNPRASASTAAGHVLSPTSPQQIHYHIHLPPGAAAAAAANNFPPGSIIHEYTNDEPAPEYSERPETPTETGTVQHQPPT